MPRWVVETERYVFTDHCPAHPKELINLRNIHIEFLPPNTTAVLKPMEQGIIKVMKQQFMKKLVYQLLLQIKLGSSN
jgi:hypothetical protein